MLLLHLRLSEVSLRNLRALSVSGTSQRHELRVLIFLPLGTPRPRLLGALAALLSASQFHGSLDTHVSAPVSLGIRAPSEC